MSTVETSVKVIPLGGLEQIGMNMTVFEYGESIIVVDCGMSFPGDEMLGIDMVIPDITYLKQNIHKVKGVFKFRYLRTVIVTAAVYWGLNSKLRVTANLSS